MQELRSSLEWGQGSVRQSVKAGGSHDVGATSHTVQHGQLSLAVELLSAMICQIYRSHPCSHSCRDRWILLQLLQLVICVRTLKN